jgi:hypothetical protein
MHKNAFVLIHFGNDLNTSFSHFILFIGFSETFLNALD